MDLLKTDNGIEILQKKARNRFIILMAIGGITFLLGLYFCVLYFLSDGENILMSVILAIVVDVVIHGAWLAVLYFILAKTPYERFNTAFKEHYVLETIQQAGLFENVVYDMKGGFDYDTIRQSAVVNCGDRTFYLSEDMLKGQYKNTEFHFSDVTTRKKVIRRKKAEIDTIFDGQVMRFAVFNDNKASDEYLQIFEKEFLSNIKGWTAQHQVETESTSFNSKYQIFSDSEHNAFYILTPQFLEKIADFSISVGAQIAISFHGTVMFVAINRNISMFDGKVDIPIAKQKEGILNDIRLLQMAGDILLQRQSEVAQMQE